jgi:hypothetical protein
MSTLVAPEGFRPRTAEGTARFGLVCNGCGYCADPDDPAGARQPDIDAAAARHNCPPPTYNWDFWHRRARRKGVDPELAELGRQVYRDAIQHAWNFRIDEDKMIGDALRDPIRTAERWSMLLSEEL